MNGIHDLGGMQDFGPVKYERNAPFFDHSWEARIFSLNMAFQPLPYPKRDSIRLSAEALSPLTYLQTSYYEKYVIRLGDMLTDMGLVTRAEIASGRPAPGAPHHQPVLPAGELKEKFFKPDAAPALTEGQHRFKVGDAVVSRNLNPEGHTRQPRYTRGRRGTIVRDLGFAKLEDLPPPAGVDPSQRLYWVRFTLRDLWGEAASPTDAVMITLWDYYLDLAEKVDG